MLGRIFSRHPHVAFWEEPRHVWMHAFMYRRYDILGGRDASSRVIRRINRTFEAYVDEHGVGRFAEKTPSNIVRLPFLKKAMPDCRVIHIIRDGRASTSSALQVLAKPARGRVVKSRVPQTAWWHYPAYIWRTIVRPRLPGGSIPYWGARMPGLRERARKLTKEEVCAWQWQEAITIARRDARDYPADQYGEWRYEDLVTDPVSVVKEMFDFAGLSWLDEVERWIREKIHTRAWKNGDSISRRLR